jgi:hypothetical protein
VIATDTEERVVLDVDLDLVLPCNVRRDNGCERPAEWVWHCSGCGHPSQPCTPHRIKLDRWAEVQARIGLILCQECLTKIPTPVPWSPL